MNKASFGTFDCLVSQQLAGPSVFNGSEICPARLRFQIRELALCPSLDSFLPILPLAVVSVRDRLISIVFPLSQWFADLPIAFGLPADCEVVVRWTESNA